MTQTGSRPLPSQERRSPPETATREPGLGWVTIREAHEQTGVPMSTLRYWAREGRVESQLDLTDSPPRRLVALDEVITRMQRRARSTPAAPAPSVGPPTPPARPTVAPSRDQRPPDGAMMVPIDAWNKMLNQLGNLHEAGRQLAEARERAARAETEAQFLRERLSELREEMTSRESTPSAEAPEPRLLSWWFGLYERWRRRRP